MFLIKTYSAPHKLVWVNLGNQSIGVLLVCNVYSYSSYTHWNLALRSNKLDTTALFNGTITKEVTLSFILLISTSLSQYSVLYNDCLFLTFLGELFNNVAYIVTSIATVLCISWLDKQ